MILILWCMKTITETIRICRGRRSTDINRGLGRLQTNSTNRTPLQRLGTISPNTNILGVVFPPPPIDLLAADQPQARIQKLILDTSTTEARILKQRATGWRHERPIRRRRRGRGGEVRTDAKRLPNQQPRVGRCDGLGSGAGGVLELHSFCAEMKKNKGNVREKNAEGGNAYALVCVNIYRERCRKRI